MGKGPFNLLALLPLLGALATPALASPALGGIEGALDFPTSEVSHDSTMTFGIGYLGSGTSYLFPEYPNRFYTLSARIVPGLEVTARFTEVLGLHDPSILLPNFVDRLLAAKWRLPIPAGWPELAVGGVDLFSINELNRLKGYVPGSSRHGAAIYAVGGGTIGRLRVDLGYAYGTGHLQGPFAILRLPIGWGVSAIAEAGNARYNLGLDYASPTGLGLKLGWMQSQNLGLVGSYAFHL